MDWKKKFRSTHLWDTYPTHSKYSNMTANKPLASEPSLSVMNEYQCVGKEKVCNESTTATWLSCNVSETNRVSWWLCRTFQYVNVCSEKYSRCPCQGCRSSCVSCDLTASPLVCHCRTWGRTGQAMAILHTWTSFLQGHITLLNNTVHMRSEVLKAAMVILFGNF